MAQLLAYCGLDCAECDARKATLNDDQALRAATAARWSAEFHFPFTAEMINCTGCREPGAKIGHCAECELRSCGEAKALAHCGLCAEFPGCAKIAGFIKDLPQAKANLEAARRGA
ncbi:MAG TPA: DUF3795 domain-containing protein [Spirochaetales bacterium]|nr:DUF3795 domain-containing protein [Spirochaetales bacterium]HRY55576.1 DUF3795 domain-containing protein [Spirochaetia bacterium]HRZ65344.1 DUF3795 domain-containing protein [Spirochaetia bacterium]